MADNIVGIDIGGTNLRFGIVGKDGAVKRSFIMPFKKYADNNVEKQVNLIVNNTINFLAENKKYDIKGIGIGIAGQIDAKSGDVLFSPNLNWRNVPLKKTIEKETSLTVNITNDLTAITYGEWKFGAGKGGDDLICIFVGTGIGSGIVLNCDLHSGCSNSAGEIGHTTVVSGGRKCTCGNLGCLEAYAGGWGIAEIAKERALLDKNGFKNIIETAGSIPNITAQSITKAYDVGDENAIKLIKETGIYLSDGVITTVNLLNPCIVILGGGVIDAIPDLFEIVKEEVYKRALKASVSGIKILKSELGENAGVIGAAGLAADHARRPCHAKLKN